MTTPESEPMPNEWRLDQLLDGAPASSGPEHALHHLVRAANAPATEQELASEASVLAAYSAHVSGVSQIPPSPLHRRLRMLSTLPTGLIASAAAAGVLTLGGTAAAAYTGSLPAPLQDVVHHVIGAPAADASQSTAESAPETSTETSTEDATRTTPTDSATGTATPSSGPDATGPAAFGLCNAFTHGGLATTSVAYAALVKAADGAGKVADYCAKVSHPGATARPGGSPTDHPSGEPTGLPTHTTSSHATGSGTAAPHPTGSPSTHPTGAPTSRPPHPGGR